MTAALLPLAQIAATPVTVAAHAPCPESGACGPGVPEPSTLLLLAPAAAWLVRRQLKK